MKSRAATDGTPLLPGTSPSIWRSFLIVTLHEFGHALACRQVGGQANQIVLWPLGGVAYVDPPPRPGATLWSIAAGPLVNVVLLPILLGLDLVGGSLGWAQTMPDLYRLVELCFPLTWPAGFQHSAHLSPGWRPDSSLAPVVRAGPRPQLDGGHDPRIRSASPVSSACVLDAVDLATLPSPPSCS
jgi:hypothetical protein